MTKELLSQLKDFEIFVEKLEELVQEVKELHLTDYDGNTYRFEDFDLRDDKIGNIGSLPTKLEDYFEFWKYVQERYQDYLANYKNDSYPNEMFFDLYWNDVEANSAYYDNATLWIFFDYEYGIYYLEDEDINQKIVEREKC